MSAPSEFRFKQFNWEGGDPLEYVIPGEIVQEFLTFVLTDNYVRHLMGEQELLLFHERCMQFRRRAHQHKVRIYANGQAARPLTAPVAEIPAMALERGGDPVTAAQVKAFVAAQAAAGPTASSSPASAQQVETPRKRGRPRKH